MSKLLILLLCAIMACDAANTTVEDTESPKSEGSEESEDHDEFGENPMCMSHCSYICMTNGGKPETCLKLMGSNKGINVISSLPPMASCPASTTVLNDCYLKCGCQCTRCGICFLKNFNIDAATAACKASPNLNDCLKNKKDAVLKACN